MDSPTAARPNVEATIKLGRAETTDRIWQPLQSNATRIISLKGGISHYFSCELEEITFTEDVPSTDFSALSYTWGDIDEERDQVPIRVHNQMIPIYPNLHSALVHIWTKSPRLKLWVDALSIDQTNGDERGQQIFMMSQIFGRAKNVIIWMGKLPPLEREPMRRAWEVMSLLRVSDMDLPMAARSVFPEDYDWRSSLINSLQFISERDWFYRVWTFQEIILAQSAEVVCGHLSMSWADFIQACNLLCDGLNVRSLMRRPWENAQQRRAAFRKGPNTLTDLLMETFQRKAKEPKDKIFALLGLLQKDVFLPKYQEGLQATVMRAMRHCIIEEKSLKVLELAQPFDPPYDGVENDDQFPEWGMVMKPESLRGDGDLYCSTEEQYMDFFSNRINTKRRWLGRTSTWIPNFEDVNLRHLVIHNYRSRLIPHPRAPVVIETARDEVIGLSGFVIGALYQNSPDPLDEQIHECWKIVPISSDIPSLANFHISLKSAMSKFYTPKTRGSENPEVLAALLGWWRASHKKFTTWKHIPSRSPHTEFKTIESGLPPSVYDADWLCILPGAEKPCVLRPYIREIANDSGLRYYLDYGRKSRLEKFRFMGMVQDEICTEVTDEWKSMLCVPVDFFFL